MSNEVTEEELGKVRPGIINEQAVLLLNLSKVMKDIVLYPPTRLGYDYFSCLLDKEPAFLHNHLFGYMFLVFWVPDPSPSPIVVDYSPFVA